MSEQLICVRRVATTWANIPQNGFARYTNVGFNLDGNCVDVEFADAGDRIWLPHSYKTRTPELEQDEDWKQVCSYAVVQAGDKILSYRRGKAGSEDRLHSQISIGIGGHCNAPGMLQEARREVAEETNLEHFGEMSTLGIVNDQAGVGKHHIGVVCLLKINEEWQQLLKPREDCIRDLEWRTVEELRDIRDEVNFETWSAHIINHESFYAAADQP